jgi:hypothetical protein
MRRFAVIISFLAMIVAGFGIPQALAKPVINLPYDAVTDLERGQELYEVVNNPAYAGYIIQLSSGVYLLDPAKPKNGRLVLQPGMEIVGENQYVDCDGDGVYDPVNCVTEPLDHSAQFTTDGTQTLIDGSAITNQPGAQPGPGLIRLGRDNRLSHITVRGPEAASFISANVHINLDVDGVVSAKVSDILVEGGAAGIRCNNPPLIPYTFAQAKIERNIVRNAVTWGIVINNPNTDGNAWEVGLNYNRIYNNTAGIFILNNQSAFAETRVVSRGNVIEFNKAGIMVMAGQDAGGQVGRGGSNNFISLVSQEDMIRNNTGRVTIQGLNNIGGGVVAMAGGNVTPSLSASSGNELVLQFLDTRFEDNNYMANDGQLYLNHASVFGYWTYVSREAGTNNTARAHVRLGKEDETTDGFWMRNTVSLTPDLSGNEVTVKGSNVTFKVADPDGLPIPTN